MKLDLYNTHLEEMKERGDPWHMVEKIIMLYFYMHISQSYKLLSVSSLL